ncbi:MAG: DUF3857 domain-containing protein [Symploca sp. SIO3C6]|nr:DUF3857 domain-containing protein [Symploca sp. SIO3C6]
MKKQPLQLLIASLWVCIALPSIAQTNHYLTTTLKTQPVINTVSVQTALASSEESPNTAKTQSVIENIRVDNYESSYTLNSDYTYSEMMTQRFTLLTPLGVNQGQRVAKTYYPESQSLELIEAYVIQPDGKKIEVSKDNIFTRPTPESQNAPGFSSSLTTTVVFPQLQIGSEIFVKWKLIQKTPPLLGFNIVDSPSFYAQTVKRTVKIIIPDSLELNWKHRGDYAVTAQTRNRQRIITAVIENQPARKPEAAMVSLIDVSPVFVASSLSSWEEVGKLYWQQEHSKVEVTSEIKELANKITGNKQGREAARTIYNWIAQNINYVAVYLNQNAGYVPHTSTEILNNGYGDCKDYVVLMRALLKAKGMDSYPVLVHWGGMTRKLPLWTPAQFNHAIIYLPEYNIFANPTSEYASFGMLDQDLEEQLVVIAAEESRTAHIPNTIPNQNHYSLSSTVTLLGDGTVEGESELTFIGTINATIRQIFSGFTTPDQIADNWLAQTPEGGYGNLVVSDVNNLDQPMTLQGKWTSPLAINMGKQTYFSTPLGIDFIHLRQLRKYITSGKRLYPVFVGAMEMNWQYKIKLPQDYKVSHIPGNIDFSNDAGEYTSSYKTDGVYIVVKRHLIINKNIYSPQEYPAFKELMYKPVNDARSVMVLQKLVRGHLQKTLQVSRNRH